MREETSAVLSALALFPVFDLLLNAFPLVGKFTKVTEKTSVYEQQKNHRRLPFRHPIRSRNESGTVAVNEVSDRPHSTVPKSNQPCPGLTTRPVGSGSRGQGSHQTWRNRFPGFFFFSFQNFHDEISTCYVTSVNKRTLKVSQPSPFFSMTFPDSKEFRDRWEP